jgi:hypothetical protein
MGYGFSGSPFQNCFDGGNTSTEKCRCGVPSGALPVVPTYPRMVPCGTNVPAVRPSA